jgi:tetratricopeptide (TPR) repeat protein
MALEGELLSFSRGWDIPGAAIPRAYFDYLQRRPAPALQPIFTHNVHDVVSLAALTVHACDRVTFEPAALDEPLDLFSLARILESSPDWRRSIRIYEMALDGGLPQPFKRKALENLALLYRRAGEHERALGICEGLMSCADFSMTAYEGAAIYYERIARDYEAALRVLNLGLVRAENHRRKSQLEARWHRLQQKTLFQSVREK